ncbi:hypothetical protein E4U24_000937 [Claviceps purpurea]|nr:hypothetical protein E4U24_000937 [Claviceps purpurea]KAG6291591.1 hypothetical protein E4U45_007128 [Claviceps purpurea]
MLPPLRRSRLLSVRSTFPLLCFEERYVEEVFRDIWPDIGASGVSRAGAGPAQSPDEPKLLIPGTKKVPIKMEERQIHRLGTSLWTIFSCGLSRMLEEASEDANKALSRLSRSTFPTTLTSDAEDYCASDLSKEPRPFRRQFRRKGQTRG